MIAPPPRFCTLGGMFGVIVTAIPALGCFVLMVVLWRQLRRKTRALPRLIVTTGVVREMRTQHQLTKTGGKRGYTIVNVDFVVAGTPYVCRDLWLFAGNNHMRDVGALYDFPAGKEVGLYYDPADPSTCALIVDQPRHFYFIWAGLCGVMFTAMFVLAWRQWQQGQS
jgi:hypothetical protein